MNPEVEVQNNNDQADSVATAGGEPPVENDRFDEFRLNLNRDAFHSIDTDSSNHLSLAELQIASTSEEFSVEQKEAIAGLKQHLENAPKMETNLGVTFHPVIGSWFDRNFAQDQISVQDFNIIDANKDTYLSREELVKANDSAELSPMSKHAASILKEEIDMRVDDPLFKSSDVKIRDWIRTPEQSEAREKAEKLADKIADRLSAGTVKPDNAFGVLFPRSYSDIQNMWNTVERLPGDPKDTMERLMNKELRDTGHEVKIYSSSIKGAPPLPWIHNVKAFMSINPRPGEGRSPALQLMGRGVIGLGHSFDARKD